MLYAKVKCMKKTKIINPFTDLLAPSGADMCDGKEEEELENIFWEA